MQEQEDNSSMSTGKCLLITLFITSGIIYVLLLTRVLDCGTIMAAYPVWGGTIAMLLGIIAGVFLFLLFMLSAMAVFTGALVIIAMFTKDDKPII